MTFYWKHKLKNILDNFDESTTEQENMLNRGYRIIWDYGNGVWVYKNNKPVTNS